MSNQDDLLAFWFAEGPDTVRPAWFKADPAFDESLRTRFGGLTEAAAAGELADWSATPAGSLALCLLLDQLPRNLHRGTARAYATDPAARAVARHAVLTVRHDLALTTVQRMFLYLPFEHSEAVPDQDLSVALFEGLRDDPRHAAPGGAIEYAWQHRAVIRRFGRFPRRNAALGRGDTAAERAYLTASDRVF